jgi:putative Mn2+ efflux pump MntP
MNGILGTLVGLLALWMAACCFCGFKGRFVAFLAVLMVGLGANLCWMVFGLNAHVLEVNVLIAQTSAVIYAVCAFAIGLFLGRIQRKWVESRVEGS